MHTLNEKDCVDRTKAIKLSERLAGGYNPKSLDETLGVAKDWSITIKVHDIIKLGIVNT